MFWYILGTIIAMDLIFIMVIVGTIIEIKKESAQVPFEETYGY